MPRGPLGFPRLTSIGPFVTDDIEWVLNHRVFHKVWGDVANSDHVHFGPDPPVLIVNSMDYGFEDESMNEMLFSRLPDKRYGEPDKWENIPNRFTLNESTVTLGRVTDPERPDLHPNSIKFQSQMYTNTGGMITFDFKQERGEPVYGMMRVPATRESIREVERGVHGLPHFEHFHMQSRAHRGQFQKEETDRDSYLHPHFRSTGIKTEAEMKKVFEFMVQASERYNKESR